MPTTQPTSGTAAGAPRCPIIVANWKMQLTAKDSVARIEAVAHKLGRATFGCDVVVCPSFMSLLPVREALGSARIALGAQDVFWDAAGPYTGEISPVMLAEAGVTHVIIGHSERRQVMGETNTMIARKLLSVLSHGMQPILCVGETAHERNDGDQDIVVGRQLLEAFRSAPPPPAGAIVSIAYEPVWAIGTGQPASAETARDMRQFIEHALIDLYGNQLVSRSFRFLYGGSVDATNITQYVAPGAYDGALVGSASLDPTSFATILKTVHTRFTKHPS